MKYIKYQQHLTEICKKYRYLYFCFLNTKLVYVGATHLIQNRLRDHRFPFNEYRFIKGKTEQINRWEKKLIKKYKPINNYIGLPRRSKWVRENGSIIYFHNGAIVCSPIFPKVNSKYKDPKYNKSEYYRRERPSGYEYPIVKAKNNALWFYCEDGRLTKLIKQNNNEYKIDREDKNRCSK